MGGIGFAHVRTRIHIETMPGAGENRLEPTDRLRDLIGSNVAPTPTLPRKSLKEAFFMTELATGMPAPDFTLPTDDGDSFTLSAQRGKSVLLYFYPQANTPACNDQNLAFTTHAQDFAAKGIVLVGISPDPVEKLRKFRETFRLSPILVSDSDHVALEAYGVWGEKRNYGRTYMGLIRSTFLVDPEGNLSEIWRNIRAKGHVERVLKAIG